MANKARRKEEERPAHPPKEPEDTSSLASGYTEFRTASPLRFTAFLLVTLVASPRLSQEDR